MAVELHLYPVAYKQLITVQPAPAKLASWRCRQAAPLVCSTGVRLRKDEQQSAQGQNEANLNLEIHDTRSISAISQYFIDWPKHAFVAMQNTFGLSRSIPSKLKAPSFRHLMQARDFRLSPEYSRLSVERHQGCCCIPEQTRRHLTVSTDHTVTLHWTAYIASLRHVAQPAQHILVGNHAFRLLTSLAVCCRFTAVEASTEADC